jgi:hypothetical protein
MELARPALTGRSPWEVLVVCLVSGMRGVLRTRSGRNLAGTPDERYNLPSMERLPGLSPAAGDEVDPSSYAAVPERPWFVTHFDTGRSSEDPPGPAALPGEGQPEGWGNIGHGMEVARRSSSVAV